MIGSCNTVPELPFTRAACTLFPYCFILNFSVEVEREVSRRRLNATSAQTIPPDEHRTPYKKRKAWMRFFIAPINTLWPISLEGDFAHQDLVLISTLNQRRRNGLILQVLIKSDRYSLRMGYNSPASCYYRQHQKPARFDERKRFRNNRK